MRGASGASEANRQKVLQVAKELGYVPDARARVLRQGRSQLLGVMFGIQQPFHADLLEGIYAAAEDARYDVVLSGMAASRGEDRAVDTLLADRCEALILLAPQSPRAWLAGLADRLPTVVVARSIAEPGIDVVRTAEAKGIELAVDHLAELGHARIAHIDGGNSPGATERRKGYRAAMRRHGLSGGECMVPGGMSEDDGARGVFKLLGAGELPTAILAFNDRCATGVLDTLLRAGIRVPEQVSVVGFDDTHHAGFSHIDLTTVRQDAALMARLSVAHAIRRLEGFGDRSRSSREDVVSPALVVRGTTAKPRPPASN
jgi:DNA-binding LacI/PurR family transcriptional regulator